MWDLFKTLPEFLLIALVVSAALLFIKNKRTRNRVAAIAGVLGLIWFLGMVILAMLTRGSPIAVAAVFVLLCALMFVIHYGSRALAKRENPPKS